MKEQLAFFKGLIRSILSFLQQNNRIKKIGKEKKSFFKMLRSRPDLAFEIGTDFICPDDKTLGTEFDRHYLYHPAWAIRKIVLDIKPQKHIDISSILYFSSMLSAVVPVEFYDYRPAEIELDNLSCGKADLTNLFFKTGSVESISCMHTVEHIGLGRYGDPLDPQAT